MPQGGSLQAQGRLFHGRSQWALCSPGGQPWLRSIVIMLAPMGGNALTASCVLDPVPSTGHA